ncbi:transposase [Streptomyces sp. NPDC102402]|uniref:transposase n=1 Tax=Streptomyces sp. NPDC102402 TaxID=3366169 RepID=UPI003821084C
MTVTSADRHLGRGAGRSDSCGVGRLWPFLPVVAGRCGGWRDHRQVIDGILHRVRTGIHRRDLPERFGPWKTVYGRYRLWSADGTWERLLQQVRAEVDAVGEIGWDIGVDSTVVRARQYAAGARTGPPPARSRREGCLAPGERFGCREGVVDDGNLLVPGWRFAARAWSLCGSAVWVPSAAVVSFGWGWPPRHVSGPARGR